MRNEGNKFAVTMVAVTSNFSNRSANNGEQQHQQYRINNLVTMYMPCNVYNMLLFS